MASRSYCATHGARGTQAVGMTREQALVHAFSTVRREVWTRRELALRRLADAGANWTIA